LSKIEGVAWREITALLARLSVREPKLSDAFDHRGALRLAASYSCLGHDAPMDLFATDDTVAGADSDSLGWSDVHRGPLKIHRMGGDHASMFDDPYVGVLSEMVTRSARDALHAPERS
jgi:thioesterase domain-containing protein